MKWEDIEEGAFIPFTQIEEIPDPYQDLTLKESDSFEVKDGLYFQIQSREHEEFVEDSIIRIVKEGLRGYLFTLNSNSFYKTEKEKEGDSPYLYVKVGIEFNEWEMGNIKILKIANYGEGGYWDYPAYSEAVWDSGGVAIYRIGKLHSSMFMNWINENPFEVKQ